MLVGIWGDGVRGVRFEREGLCGEGGACWESGAHAKARRVLGHGGGIWRPYRTRDDLFGLTWGDAPGWYRLSLWDKWMTVGWGGLGEGD
jgi:hypothetical protein